MPDAQKQLNKAENKANKAIEKAQNQADKAQKAQQPRLLIRRAGVGDLDPAAIAAGVLERHPQRPPLQVGLRRGGPLDEGHRVRRQVVLEQRRVLLVEAVETVEVEMGDGGPALA